MAAAAVMSRPAHNHGVPAIPAPRHATAATAAKAKASTKQDDSKKVRPDRYKTKMCKNFMEKGCCPYESRCMFAHGEHELRTTQMNHADGLNNEESIRQHKRLMQMYAEAEEKQKKMAAETTKRPPRPVQVSSHRKEQSSKSQSRAPRYTLDYEAFADALEAQAFEQEGAMVPFGAVCTCEICLSLGFHAH